MGFFDVTADEALSVVCPSCGATVKQWCFPSINSSRDVRAIAETDPEVLFGRTHATRIAAVEGR